MKLATFAGTNGPEIGVVADGMVVPLRGDPDLPDNMVELISRWPELKAAAKLEVEAARAGAIPLASVQLCAPVPRPGKILAIGLNYADHVAEAGLEPSKHQVWFAKMVTSVNGPFDPIQIPQASQYVDYEVELVAVIGRRGRHIPRAQARDFVFGYCVGNDVTERRWQHRTAQWVLGKSFDTHAPFGPWITTADEIADPHALEIACQVNGERRQHSNTRHMTFDLWDQIEHLSQAMTLEPGDLIFAGTPGGVGVAMDPRRFLQPADRVRCEIEGLGAIEASCVAET